MVDIEVQGRFIAVLPLATKSESGIEIKGTDLSQTFEIVGIGDEVDLSKHPNVKVGAKVWCADFFRYDYSKMKTGKDYQFTTIDKIFAVEVDVPDVVDGASLN